MTTRFSALQPSLQKLRRKESFLLLWVMAALVVLIRLSLLVIYEPYFEGDTRLLLGHINVIRICLSEGRFPGCPGAGDFPLSQNLPALALSYVGLSTNGILHGLAGLSFVSFLASVALTFWVLRRKASLLEAAVGVLVLISGPLLWYSHSTFGEMLAGFLILACAAVLLFRPYGWIHVFLFVLAGSTKDVALPFLVLMGLVCLMPELINDWGKVRKNIAWLGLGAILSFVINAGFNYFRSETLASPSYVSNPLFIVPSLRLHASFFLGMWLSPNGGLMFFWPSFTLIFLAVVVVFVYRRMRTGELLNRESVVAFLPLAALTALLFGLTLGFSRWYTPLGGFAWGPRYMLPWIPAVTLLLLYFYRPEVESVFAWLLTKPVRFAISCAVLILISIPQFTVLFDSSVMGRIFAYPECPRVPVIQEGADYYYQCLQTQIWPKRLYIAGLYSVAMSPPVVWLVLLYAVTLIGLCYAVKRACLGETTLKLSFNFPRVSSVFSSIRSANSSNRLHALTVILLYSLLFSAFFLPVFLKDHLLSVGGDGLYIYLPNFYSRKVLWDTLIFGGFPMLADPQVMSWYPPAFLLSLLPDSWNAFVLLAYIAASCFIYGYVYCLTTSRIGAAFSGTAFGLSGFMIAHLGHAVIIHAAAWIPLSIWSLEMLRRKRSAAWFVASSFAVALSCMGGHSQIFVYGLILSAAYLVFVGWDAPIGRWRYYLIAIGSLVVGIALAAVQILPAAELVGQSTRVAYSFQDFVSHALPPRQAFTLIFPLVFGSIREAGVHPYFGAVNQTELTGYVGLLPLLLSAAGIIGTKRKSLVLFWACVALVSLVLATGDATPMARLTYHLPVINQFRAPARHLLEFTLAFSVLSGLGVTAIVNGQFSIRRLLKITVFAGLAMVGVLILLYLNSGYMSALGAKQGVADLKLLPWNNRSVAIPLLVFLLGLGALIYWFKQPRSVIRTAILFSVLLIDLGSFGWFYEWRYAAQDKRALVPTVQAEHFKSVLTESKQRLMPYRGPRGLRDEMPPNLTRLWGVPSASGYNVLIPSRVQSLLPMIDYIDVPLPWEVPGDQSLNIIGARYFLMPRLDETEEVEGIQWLKKDMQIWLGTGCSKAQRDPVEFDLARPVKATGLGIVSRLACSPPIVQGTEVAQFQLTDTSGVVHSGSLRAGFDSSEWAYDCAGVTPLMKHQKARIFKDYPASMDNVPCVAHLYVSTSDFQGASEVKTVKLEWTGPAGAMIVEKVSLVDKSNNTSHPVGTTLMKSDSWRFVGESNDAQVYENLKAMPRAWLVPNIFATNPENALSAIKTSKLPDGGDFHPGQTALVEQQIELPVQEADPHASAMVTSLTDTKMEVRTSSKIANFLMTSDVYYPGWEARIDGNQTPLYRADYALRGLVVPAGQHVVLFQYSPRSFNLGALVSVLTLLGLAGLLLGNFLSGQAERKRQSH